MIFYVLIFGLLVLLRYTLQGRPKTRVQLYPFVLFAVFLFSAFRFEVGCDWTGYYYQWRGQEHSTLAMTLLKNEPTWWALMQGLQSLELSYPWLNVAGNAIFFLGVHVLARRQPDPLGFLVLLFPILIINMPMSGIRQAAAIGVICIAFAAFIDKKLFWFIALILLASSIHNSAIIFLFFAPLVGGNFTKKRLLIAVILIIPGALVLLSGEVAEQAKTRYVNSGIDAAGSAFRVGLLLITGLGYFSLFRRKWEGTFPKDYKLVSVGALVMCAMIVIVPISSVISDRIGYYLIPIQTIILARIPYLTVRNSRIYSAAPYLSLGLTFLIWTSLSWHFTYCYVPYQSWLFGLPITTPNQIYRPF